MIIPFLALLWSNGCVFDAISDARIGDMRPLKAARTTELVAETLSVVLEGDSARIHARYHLHNRGDTLRGTYGAPVDYAPSDFGNEVDTGRDGFDRRLYAHASLALDGQPPRAMASGRPKPFAGDPDRRHRRWFSRPLVIPPGEHMLDLRVTTTATFADSDIKGVSLLRTFSERVVSWDLAPAGLWGNGIVGSFVLRLDASALEGDSIRVASSWQDGVREGNELVHRRRNLDLARARPLSWTWDPGPGRVERLLRPSIWHAPRWRASSDLEGYGIANLVDGNWSTAWVAPRGGKGAWLEADIPRGVEIAALLISPGYAKSPALWTENDRIVATRIAFPGRELERYRGWDRLDGRGGDPLAPEDIPDRLGRMLFANPGGECSFEGGRRGGTLRIEIDSTLPGTRSRDVPISEIVLLKCPDPR
jgi:hypothetical protein